MMYKNNFIVVIKCNGKVLRETNGCVRLPFGSQYSILLKNLESRKSVARVSVDGDDTCSGDRIIVLPNTSVELKGKMSNGKVRHNFKFIERTKEISNYRGNKVDDGLIRVEYWFEKEYVEFEPSPWILGHQSSVYLDRCDGPFTSGGSTSSFNSSDSVTCCCSFTGNSTTKRSSSNTKNKSNVPKTDIGITVQGSKTNQDFVNGYTKPLEKGSSVVVIQLKGSTNTGARLRKEVTTKTRFKCPTCGRKSKSSAKWCSSCGTNLEI